MALTDKKAPVKPLMLMEDADLREIYLALDSRRMEAVKYIHIGRNSEYWQGKQERVTKIMLKMEQQYGKIIS
jgi:hypothetical protein